MACRPRDAVRFFMLAVAAMFLSAPSGSAELQGQPTTAPAGRRIEYAPGVWIDWGRRQVDVSARVVLREGLLELFACSPHTREHESIVAVQARPVRVYEALGLIGLQPGKPAHYDARLDTRVAASGSRLILEVTWVQQGHMQTASVWDWMADARTNELLVPREWVFSGSRPLPGGVFGADVEGTVACVVNFDTALIGLPDSYSADNSLLWVCARTKAIPPIGTECRLVVRAVGDTPVATLDAAGHFRLGGAVLTPAELARRVAKAVGESVVRIEPLAGVDGAAVRNAVEKLRSAGIEKVYLTAAPRVRIDAGPSGSENG